MRNSELWPSFHNGQHMISPQSLVGMETGRDLTAPPRVLGQRRELERRWGRVGQLPRHRVRRVSPKSLATAQL